MKNLENYGVQELNAQEITEIDGGFPWLPVIGAVATACAAAWELGEEIGRTLYHELNS